MALSLFHRFQNNELEVWVQVRTDDGPYHGMLEFPGGKIEAEEEPLTGAVREVEEEVGIKIDPRLGKFMGTYRNMLPNKTILLYVFLFPDLRELAGIGEWLKVEKTSLSSPYLGKIPPPNHQIIDDLFLSLYDGSI